MKFTASALLFSLVLAECSIRTCKSSTENQKDGTVPKTANVYVDRFHRLRKLAESDLKIVRFFVQHWENRDGAQHQLPLETYAYMKNFERATGPISTISWTSETAENIAKNPIASFKLLRRYAVDLPKLLIDLPTSIKEKVQPLTIPPNMKWPDAEDFQYAADGILTMQIYYNISVEQFSGASLPGIQLGGTLDVADIYEIGDTALYNDYYALAIQWLEFGLWKIQSESMTHPYREKFTKSLQQAKTAHDEEYKNDKDKGNRWLFDHPLLNDEGLEEIPREKRVRRRDTLFGKYKGDRESAHGDINSWGVCSGENYQTEEEKRRLFCWREFTVHPRYRIGPLKMEFLSQQPDVYMIHNFAGDSLIQKVRKTAQAHDKFVSTPFREGSYIVDEKGNGVTHFVWDGLGTTHGPLPLAQNVQDATGLKAVKADEADKLFVRFYTWATVTQLHGDAAYMANAMHYLNNVEFGGFTAFPLLGFAIKPVKGALVVWYNQLRDEEPDKLTVHVACPIIYGRKQIATKWIYPNPQFHNFPCGLKPAGRFKTKVNGRLNY